MVAKQRKDMRLDRTRMLIISTMFRLLSETTFEQISVNDICVAASVSRTTFYFHFEDKYHLVMECMAEFKRSLDDATKGGDFPSVVEGMISAIEEEQAVFRNLFTGKENRELETMLLEFLIDQCTEVLEQQRSLGVVFSVPLHVISLYASCGMAGLIVRWVTGRLPMPKAELIRCLVEMGRVDPFSAYK